MSVSASGFRPRGAPLPGEFLDPTPDDDAKKREQGAQKPVLELDSDGESDEAEDEEPAERIAACRSSRTHYANTSSAVGDRVTTRDILALP